MTDSDFAFIAGLLKERSGHVLTPDKTYLLDARLSPVAARNGLHGLQGLVDEVRTKRPEYLVAEIVDAMTINETSFFRDRHPFDAFRASVLPGLIQRRAATRTLRIWSAASSHGQEAYSLAMILRDEFSHLSNWRIEIIGTDISPTAVNRAREGVYNTFEVQRGLPIQLLIKHFDQIGDTWRVKDRLRSLIEFRVFNLLNPLAALGMFDVVFCRNVLIYFDPETKARVLGAIAGRLASDGALILGGAESMFGITDKYVGVENLRGVYRHNSRDAHQTVKPLAGSKEILGGCSDPAVPAERRRAAGMAS